MQLSAKIEAILFWKGSLSQNKTGSILSVSVKEIETGLLTLEKASKVAVFSSSQKTTK